MNEGQWNEGFLRSKSGMERRRMKELLLFVCAFEVNERRSENGTKVCASGME